MQSFVIEPRNRFTAVKPVIKRPSEIASFSFDETHTQTQDDSSLKYYYNPPVGASLSRGFESFQQLDDTRDDHLDALLQCVMAVEKKQGRPCTGELCTWRGMITKPSRPGRASQDLMSFWGYKFETLSLLPRPWDECSRDFIEARETHVVSNYEQYCSVVETSIGGTSVITAGEVDAIWDQKPTPVTSAPATYVELKTAATLTNPASHQRFTRKLLKFWAQSFILGVPKIIVGFRSDDMEGRLESLQEFDTTKIPALVRGEAARMGREPAWELGVCVGFVGQLFEFLQQHINGEGIWKIKRNDKSNTVDIWRVEQTGTGDILSREFLSWRRDLARRESSDVNVDGENRYGQMVASEVGDHT
ncbi:MAG: decapping endonuclease targeting mRNA [Chrysothrix sp. TS-e1954]|nr:MAG: decapping endonuclease targeting mRNA [Chrysothrix sp. TS-e1954]